MRVISKKRPATRSGTRIPRHVKDTGDPIPMSRFSRIVVALTFVGLSFQSVAGPSGGDVESHALSPGVTIDLPKRWSLQSFPMPIPGASNYRVETGKLRMAITGFPVPKPDNVSKDEAPSTMSEAFVKNAVMESSSQYEADAKQPLAEAESIVGQGYTGAYRTLDSENGKPVFPAFFGRTYRCVTTGMIATVDTVYSITIGSDRCDGSEHKQAVQALASIHVGV